MRRPACRRRVSRARSREIARSTASQQIADDDAGLARRLAAAHATLVRGVGPEHVLDDPLQLAQGVAGAWPRG